MSLFPDEGIGAVVGRKRTSGVRCPKKRVVAMYPGRVTGRVCTSVHVWIRRSFRGCPSMSLSEVKGLCERNPSFSSRSCIGFSWVLLA